MKKYKRSLHNLQAESDEYQCLCGYAAEALEGVGFEVCEFRYLANHELRIALRDELSRLLNAGIIAINIKIERVQIYAEILDIIWDDPNTAPWEARQVMKKVRNE